MSLNLRLGGVLVIFMLKRKIVGEIFQKIGFTEKLSNLPVHRMKMFSSSSIMINGIQ